MLKFVRQDSHQFLHFVFIFVFFCVSNLEQSIVIYFYDQHHYSVLCLYLLNGTACTYSVVVGFLNDSRLLLFAELATSSTHFQTGRVDSDLISMFAGITFGLSDVSGDSFHDDLSGESFIVSRPSPDMRRFSSSICVSMTLRISFLASCSTVGSLRY